MKDVKKFEIINYFLWNYQLIRNTTFNNLKDDQNLSYTSGFILEICQLVEGFKQVPIYAMVGFDHPSN
jgi:hypothetical protein